MKPIQPDTPSYAEREAAASRMLENLTAMGQGRPLPHPELMRDTDKIIMRAFRVRAAKLVITATAVSVAALIAARVAYHVHAWSWITLIMVVAISNATAGCVSIAANAVDASLTAKIRAGQQAGSDDLPGIAALAAAE